MGLSRRQKRVLRRELRRLVSQLAVVAGMLAGLLWALNRPEQAPPASCSRPGRGHNALSECAGDALFDGMVPYLVGMTLGALAGAVVAAILTRMLIPMPRPSSQRAAPLGRWITARYSGRCSKCRAGIEPGDRIRHTRGWSLCRRCAI